MLWLRSYIAAPQDIWRHTDFRVNGVFDVLTVPHWRFENVVQPQDEIWLISKGRCAIYQGAMEATAAPGDLVVLRTGLSRLTISLDDEPLELIGFGYSATLLGVLDTMTFWNPPLCFANTSTHIESLMQRLAQENQQGAPAYGLAVLALAQQIFVEALRCSLPLHSSNWERALAHLQAAQHGAIAHALRYIEAHFHQSLDLEQLASAVHLSPKHLSRRFKQALGLAPSEYWRRYRLQQARRQLLQSEETISHIARRCGFEDAAYFSRAFKREFGSSPQEFRSAAQKMFTANASPI